MRFRQHRGQLDDSMKTLVWLENRDELRGYVRGLLWEWPTAPPVTDETLHVKPYCQDARIGWDTHIVTLDGYGVLGFTDGPCPRQAVSFIGPEHIPQAKEEKTSDD